MKLQIVTERNEVWLRLWKKSRLVDEKKLDSRRLTETLLGELDKLLKENKIEKTELDGIESWPVNGDGGSAKIARIISVAGRYCLTKLKK